MFPISSVFMTGLPFLIIFFISFVQSDELISTRCQAKCLQDMDNRMQGDVEQRKNLKHHIIQLCKDDEECSACTTPCREAFIDVLSCKNSICKDSSDRKICEKSCEHLQSIYTEKPGACPKARNLSTYECSALCHLDGDCPETQKCCSQGCSRQCTNPIGKDTNLLPIPISISVQERKRKRSIIIRWVMQKMSKAQTSSNSNLFVIQWRWGLHAEKEAMTEWQTVTVKNKPYAILKHLLSPGRFYQFRVGAVSVQGSLGFSSPSEPFKLSKEARAPSAPRDISIGESRLTPVGLWNQKIQWTPPISDLPIKNYQLSWAVSSIAEADAFEEMMRRRSTLETHEKRSLDEEEEGWGIDKRDRHSVIVPSHSTQTELSALFPNSVYIVEVHASVDSTEGELHGEKGILFVRTLNITGHYDIITTTSNSSEEDDDIDGIESTVIQSTTTKDFTTPDDMEIQPAFYDGDLKVAINWLNSRSCSPTKKTFIVRSRKTLCREIPMDKDTKWHEISINECAAVLHGLSFDCEYSVEISESGQNSIAVAGTFSTLSCENTLSNKPIPCSSLSIPIFCTVYSHSASCHWKRDRTESPDTVIGYRVVLSSALQDTSNITIVPPQLREVYYDNLEKSTMYTVQVQTITNKGAGNDVSTTFTTPSNLPDEHLIQRFPGGEIIELPLEAASSSSNIPVLIIFLLPFIRIL